MQASSIKQTLQRQKTVLSEDIEDKDDLFLDEDKKESVLLEDVKIEVDVGETDLMMADPKLDISMNSIVTVVNENDG